MPAENIQTINSSVFTTTNNLDSKTHAHEFIGQSKTSYCFPSMAGVQDTTLTTKTPAATWKQKHNKKEHNSKHNKKQPIVGACMHMKVSLPSFWPALLANIGICILLIGYIFIGSFLFMSIENESDKEKILPWQGVAEVPLPNLENHLNPHNDNKSVKTTNVLYMDDSEMQPGADSEAEERKRTVENIWEITVSLNILYKENWTRLAALELGRFQNHLLKRAALDLATSTNAHSSKETFNTKRELYKQQSTTVVKNRQMEWQFCTAFLYSLTLVSTVGYGTLTPQTALGRAATIGYATLGIPLMLIYLSSVGNILGKLMRLWCMRFFCCCCCCCCCCHESSKNKKTELQLKQSTNNTVGYSMGSSYDNLSVNTVDTKYTQVFGWTLILPVLLCLLLWLFYITIGSIIISLLEQWPLIDGIYFCFMSLTTIGFCDLLPGFGLRTTTTTTNNMLLPKYSSTVSVWFCAVYILIGLTLISVCVKMLHEEILWRMNFVVKINKKAPSKETKKQQTTTKLFTHLP